MVVILRARGLSLTGDVLLKPESSKPAWDAAALIDVPDPSNFRITVEVVSKDRNGRFCAYLIGIVPRHANIEADDIEESTGAFLDWNGQVTPLLSGPALGTVVSEAIVVENNETLQMCFSGGCLYAGDSRGARTKVIENIPPGDYRPCISVNEPGSQFRISVGSLACKRAAACHASGVLSTMKTLWKDRTFADAHIACGAKSIAVHRCILSAASQFFARAFQGEMQEAKEARVVIKDSTDAAVEAVLQYMYTETIPAGVDRVEILTLAHRYEIAGLVDFCASELVETITQQNVAKHVAALRPIREDSNVQQHWEEMTNLIASSPLLVTALMEG